MKKEDVLKWLRECGGGNGERCHECPYCEITDCSGALMRDAADLIENQED